MDKLGRQLLMEYGSPKCVLEILQKCYAKDYYSTCVCAIISMLVCISLLILFLKVGSWYSSKGSVSPQFISFIIRKTGP